MRIPVLPALLLALALPAQAVDKKDKAMDPAQQEMMAKWAAAATPGENHRVLDALVGSWDHTVQWWMKPGEPPEKSTGTSEARWILGGRFVRQDASGVAMGQPFEGIGTIGFNNVKKEYESVWIDNMATAMMKSTGRYDPSKKTLTDTGMVTDCMDGKEKPFRGVTTFTDKNNYKYEMYMAGPDGKEFMTMRIAYKRKK